MAAASPAVIRPRSGISAISMAAETGPMWNGSQKPCFGGRSFFLRDDAFDPPLEVANLGFQHGPEVIIHALDICGNGLLPARRDLRQKPFAQVDDPRTLT